MQTARNQSVVKLPLGGPDDEQTSRRSLAVAAVLPAAAVLSAPVLPLTTRATLAVLFVMLAGLGFVLRPRGKGRSRPRRWVKLDAVGIVRSDEKGETMIGRWNAPLGMTILSNHERTRLLLAFTTQEHTRYVPVRIKNADEATRARDLFSHASTVADADLLLGSEHDQEALSASSALRLLEIVGRRAPKALGQCYLTDTRGTVVVLEGQELRLGDRIVDLRSPVEWRSFLFHESLGHLTTLYQATWLRQASVEAVLVSALPSDVVAPIASRNARALLSDSVTKRAIVRDRRLMQALPDAPPPHEQRVGIERLFMLPLRRALDGAPRLSKTTFPPTRSVPGHPRSL